MSNNRENNYIQNFYDNPGAYGSASLTYKHLARDIQENVSPYIIKKSGQLGSSTNKKNPVSECFNSPNFKMYTPSPGLKEKLSDRFIPCKKGVNLLAQFEMTKAGSLKDDLKNNVEINYNNIEDFLNNNNATSQTSSDSTPQHANAQSSNQNGLQNSRINTPIDELNKNKNYTNLLKSSLFGDEAYSNLISKTICSPTGENENRTKVFRFKTESKKKPFTAKKDLNEIINSLKQSNGNISQRKINKTPFKILDAPNLMDDFYLNLVDWSSQNDLTVGLLNSVYIWSANKSKVNKLCEYGSDCYVSSVIWNPTGTHVAVGTSEGLLDIWDAQIGKKVRSLDGHSARIGVIAWSRNAISTGSKDYNILNRDLREPDSFYERMEGHNQEVCGLKWSFDETQLASGGNDNKLFIWSHGSTLPLAKFSHHNAAVKAIAWSPHQKNLLASGGGTSDRCIRFWNTNILQQTHYVDTGSQVCNLMFSKSSNELVSTHGYSLNQIIVWSYPTMEKLATLTGHTYRVLYLAMSPDGQNIVTGAGDERLRFWNVFPQIKNNSEKQTGSSLFPSNFDVR